MRATSDLSKLQGAIQHRLVRIRSLYKSIAIRPSNDCGLVATGCVLELDNLAISALREFTISSLRRARTVLGHRISTDRWFSTEEEISAYVFSIINTVGYNRLGRPITIKREKEPTIRDPKNTEKILASCNASNLPSLQTALSLNVSLFRDIATVRNFYAHRNKHTWHKVRDKARNMNLLSVRHPDDLVQAIVKGRPVSVFEDWLTDAELFFEELMK